MMDDIRDRVTRTETNIENLKENFANFSAEVRQDYKRLLDEVTSMKTQITKLVIIVTLLAQGAGQVAGPAVKAIFGLS